MNRLASIARLVRLLSGPIRWFVLAYAFVWWQASALELAQNLPLTFTEHGMLFVHASPRQPLEEYVSKSTPTV